jgi:hypothetical protein
MNLRLRTPAGSVTITCPEDTTYSSLISLIQTTLDSPTINFEILFGYPPQSFQLESDSLISKSLKENDTLIIKFIENRVPQLSEQKGKKSSKKSLEKKIAKKTTVSAPPPVRGFGSNIHTLTGSSVKNLNKISSKKGQRTSSLSTPSAISPPRRRSRTNLHLQSEDDIGSQLINALNGSTGKSNQFLRHVFHRAVSHQYDQTKAEARVTSLQSGKYSLEGNFLSRTLANDLPTKINVKFHKGIGHRSFYFETVDLLTLPALRAVVTLLLGSAAPLNSHPPPSTTVVPSSSTPPAAASSSALTNESRARELSAEAHELGDTNREFLRPHSLSRCSPRVFWSLVYHYGPNIPLSLSHLLPLLDWKWMTVDCDESGEGRRMITLSEKAQENERQRLLEEEEKERKKLLTQMRRERKQRGGAASVGTETGAKATRGRKRKTEAMGEEEEKDGGKKESDEPQTGYRPPSEELSRELINHLIPSPLCVIALYQTLSVDCNLKEEPPKIQSIDALLENVSFSSLLLSLADLPIVCHDPSPAEDNQPQVASAEMMSLITRVVTAMTHLTQLLNSTNSHFSSLPFLSFSHLVSWVHVCRETIFNEFWRSFFDLYHSLSPPDNTVFSSSSSTSTGPVVSSQLLSEYLSSCRILHPKDLSLWRNSSTDFMEYLFSSFSSSHSAPSQPQLSLSVSTLTSLCLLAQSFRDLNSSSWSESWRCPERVNPFLIPLRERGGGNPLNVSSLYTHCSLSLDRVLTELEQSSSESDTGVSDQWMTILSSSSLSMNHSLCLLYVRDSDRSPSQRTLCEDIALGRCVLVDLSSQDGEEEEKGEEAEETGDGGNERELGVIVAYLAATEEEPMALWKIHLQRGDFIDLDEEELQRARREYELQQ